MSDYQQTDTSSTLSIAGSSYKWHISAGAAAGSTSRSAVVASAGAGIQSIFEFSMGAEGGTIDTATWVGVVVMRLNITTANTNVTWSELHWWGLCSGGIASSSTAITVTTGLALSLGTTGVKTASVESTVAFIPECTTASSHSSVILRMSSAATMSATFNYINNQLVTFPFTASAAPAPSAVFTLAQMNVGQ